MVYTSKRLNSVEETRLPTFKVFKYPNKCGHKKHLCELNITMWSNKRRFVNDFFKKVFILIWFLSYRVWGKMNSKFRNDTPWVNVPFLDGTGWYFITSWYGAMYSILFFCIANEIYSEFHIECSNSILLK